MNGVLLKPLPYPEVLTASAMDATAIVKLIGGLGMFLLGIHHLTEGLKDLAGDSLRRALTRLVAGRVSAIASGVVFTVLIQSSTAAILTMIGFISAGLMTFVQAIGVIMGATLGTTSTPWMVAYFGFRVRIASFAMPMLGVGALLWLVAKGRARSLGAVIAGFGLLFTGIDYMQNGMKGVTWNFEGFSGPGSMWLLAAIGIGMTIVMQSSSAAAATTLVALNAGALSFEQACALIVGQSIGTTGTTALVMIGAGLAVRRAALAHILFSAIVGLLGMVFLGPLTAAAEWVGSHLDNPDSVLAVAAFSNIFKFAGIAVFIPFMNRFAGFIARITGGGSESAFSRSPAAPSTRSAGASPGSQSRTRHPPTTCGGPSSSSSRSRSRRPTPARSGRGSFGSPMRSTILSCCMRTSRACRRPRRRGSLRPASAMARRRWPPGSKRRRSRRPRRTQASSTRSRRRGRGCARSAGPCASSCWRTARAGLEQIAWADSALHHAAGVARSLHGDAEE
ncbi:MAG TPA: Na/Pi symporter [Blastocatellia bacterium]|nr:Na/Pi symporter [Blastocatellia bacterium]